MKSDVTALQDRLGFLRIDERTCALLRSFLPVLREDLDAILDAFYRHVGARAELASMVTGQTDRLKAGQKQHWERLFAARFDEAYLETARRIGHAHEKIGLELRWYVAGYTFVLNEITERVVTRARRGKQREAADLVAAINKAVMLDIDIVTSVYFDAVRDTYTTTQGTLAESLRAQVSEIADGVATAATDIEHAAQALNRTTQQSRESSEGANAASDRAAGNVERVAAAAQELSASIAEINRHTGDSQTILNEAVAQARATNETVESLNGAVGQITDILEIISGIAKQTSLLALNATIEAARAGEAGKGFAVVASEVKDLASQTGKATDQITARIEQMKDVTASAVAAIAAIGDTIDRLNQISGTIAVAVEQQSTATGEIATNVQDAAEATKDVTRNIGQVSESAASAGDAATDVLSAAVEQSRQSGTLRDRQNAFVKEKQAA